MASALTVEVRSSLNADAPVRISDDDLFDSPRGPDGAPRSRSESAAPSLATRALLALVRPEVKLSSPYFGSHTWAPAGPPTRGSELATGVIVAAVLCLAVYGAVRLVSR